MSYLDEIYEVWTLVLKNIEEKKTRSFTEIFFKGLKIDSYSNNVITFSTDSKFKYEKIKENHLELLKEEFSNFFPCDVEIIFVGDEPNAEEISCGREPS